jgi:F0F1-type ATP synthase assembly protein I
MAKKDDSMRQVGKYLGLAFLLPTCTFVGYVIGYLLDKAFHTRFLTFTFLLFGIAAGFIELIRELNRDNGPK